MYDRYLRCCRHADYLLQVLLLLAKTLLPPLFSVRSSKPTMRITNDVNDNDDDLGVHIIFFSGSYVIPSSLLAVVLVKRYNTGFG